MKILQLVSVMLFALVTGVFWGTWFSLSRSMDTITAATFLEVGQIMIANLGRPMSLLLPAAILSAVPIMYLLYRRNESAAFVLATGAVSLMLAAMMVTLLVNVPLDARFVECRWPRCHPTGARAGTAGSSITACGRCWRWPPWPAWSAAS